MLLSPPCPHHGLHIHRPYHGTLRPCALRSSVPYQAHGLVALELISVYYSGNKGAKHEMANCWLTASGSGRLQDAHAKIK